MDTFFRALFKESRPESIPTTGWRDVILALAVGIVELATHSVAFSDTSLSSRALVPIPLLLGGVAVSLLVIRKQYPLSCVSLALAIFIGSELLGNTLLFIPSGLYFVAQILMYNLGRWGAGRTIIAGAALAIFLVVSLELSRALQPPILIEGQELHPNVPLLATTFRLTSAVTAVYVFPLGLGYFIRYLKDTNEQNIEGARESERLEMARELHDSVAHHVTAIAVQANAGQAIAATQPEKAIERLAAIKKESTEVLSDMRRIVGSLRDQDDPAPAISVQAPTTFGVDRLLTLIETGESTPAVTMTTTGDPKNVPEVVANGLYRVVQESVTNARRHGTGATFVEVSLAIDDQLASVRISNDGDVVSPPTTDGFGLRGIIERVTLLGGIATAVPRHGGGWVVEVEIPIEEA